LIFDYRAQYTRPEDGETTHHTVTTLSIEMTKRFDLDLSLVWDRVEHPETLDDGTTPEKDDYYMIASLALDF
jgi:hypothetical protein